MAVASWAGPGPALVFDPAPLRLAAGGVARLLGPVAVVRARGPLRLAAIAPPGLPGPAWRRLVPVHTGICGSDVAQAGLAADRDNPLSAVVSFPHVMGHEIVAVEAGADGDPAATHFAVDPWVGCTVRGVVPACPACAAGRAPLCSRAGDAVGAHGAGMHLGNIAGLPGGFGSAMVAHGSALHALPDGLDPALGVLADPLAVGAHAADRVGLDSGVGGVLLVLGAGTIGLAVAAAVRDRRPEIEVLVTARWPHLAERVRALGAVPVDTAPSAVLEAVRRRCGGTVRHPWRGGAWLSGGGVHAVVDAVGAPSTLETALRVLGPRGRVVSVGVGRARRAQTTLLYYKEAALVGSNGYGAGGIPAAVAALDRAPEKFAPWLTHSEGLHRWREAFAAAMRPDRSGAVKVTLRGGRSR